MVLIGEDGSIPLLETRPGQSLSEPRIKQLIEIFSPNGWRRIQLFDLIMRFFPIIFIISIPFVIGAFSFVYALFAYIVPREWSPINANCSTFALLLLFLIMSFAREASIIGKFTSHASYFIFEFVLLLWCVAGILRTLIQYIDPSGNQSVPLRMMSFVYWCIDVVIILFVLILFLRRLLKGAVSLDEAGEFINHALARKLATTGTQKGLLATPPSSTFDQEKYRNLVTKGVMFSDFDVDLKIIAADVIEHKIRVWPASKNDRTRVSDAILASISIPFLFKPFWTPTSAFVDGGIVSNLPAWAFRRHRALNPDAYILAMSIAASRRNARLAQWKRDRDKLRSKNKGELLKL